jgi:hypothetical protein
MYRFRFVNPAFSKQICLWLLFERRKLVKGATTADGGAKQVCFRVTDNEWQAATAEGTKEEANIVFFFETPFLH